MIIRESKTIEGKRNTVDIFLEGSGDPNEEHKIIGILLCQR